MARQKPKRKRQHRPLDGTGSGWNAKQHSRRMNNRGNNRPKLENAGATRTKGHQVISNQPVVD